MAKWIAVVLLVLISGLGSIPKTEAAPKPQSVPGWVVGTYTSKPGETKIAFVHDVAEALKSWAEATHTEACGPFAVRPDGAFVVVLTTQKSQIMCVISVTPPTGAVLIGEGIHDHPTATDKSGEILLTADDHVAAKAVGDEAYASRSARWVRGEPADFSDDDYAGGPGYLVTQGRLLYQHGKGTSSVVDDHL